MTIENFIRIGSIVPEKAIAENYLANFPGDSGDVRMVTFLCLSERLKHYFR